MLRLVQWKETKKMPNEEVEKYLNLYMQEVDNIPDPKERCSELLQAINLLFSRGNYRAQFEQTPSLMKELCKQNGLIRENRISGKVFKI